MNVIWKENPHELCCSLLFPDFLTAMKFVQEMAIISEKLNHHPDWRNVYRRLDIHLTTHDAGNRLTEKDHALCDEINRILLTYQFENI